MSDEFQVGYRDPHIGTIVRIDDVTPPAPARQLDYVFEIVNYTTRVMLNDHELETLSGWTEGGKGNALAQASEFCIDHKIGPNSDVTVIVVERKSYRRMRPTVGRTYGPKFDSLNYGCCRDVPADSESIIWSSKVNL